MPVGIKNDLELDYRPTLTGPVFTVLRTIRTALSMLLELATGLYFLSSNIPYTILLCEEMAHQVKAMGTKPEFGSHGGGKGPELIPASLQVAI